MSKANDLLDRCRQCGLTLAIEGDRIAIRPANRVRPELLEEIRQAKPLLMKHLSHLPDIPIFSEYDARLICDHVIRQGRPALDRCLPQSVRYWNEYKADHLDCDAAAAIDYILHEWRGTLRSLDRAGQIMEIVAKMRFLAEDFAQCSAGRDRSN